MREINIDGLIGPTHHYGGLGVGNRASEQSRHQESHPRAAALEGLHKMERVASYGVPQFYLPPPTRPAWRWLESLGFYGSQADILKRCRNEFPHLLSAAFSSAFMWTANAASTSASCDTIDGLTTVKIANLSANLHRSIEADERWRQLRLLFCNDPQTRVEGPLFPSSPLRDEGAANSMRLCGSQNPKGVYVFVYGDGDRNSTELFSNHRPPRQSQLASRLVAQSLRLPSDRCLFWRQTREALDAGVFHNDVIATSHENLLLYHEKGIEDVEQSVGHLAEHLQAVIGEPLQAFRVTNGELPLEEAVETYLFNSQIVTQADGHWRMICPIQCQRSPQVQGVLQRLLAAVPRLAGVDYVELDQSMANGGGPACLRLRCVLEENQVDRLPASSRIQSITLDKLCRLIEKEYPERLTIDDLADVEFARHTLQISKQIEAMWGPKSA